MLKLGDYVPRLHIHTMINLKIIPLREPQTWIFTYKKNKASAASSSVRPLDSEDTSGASSKGLYVGDTGTYTGESGAETSFSALPVIFELEEEDDAPPPHANSTGVEWTEPNNGSGE